MKKAKHSAKTSSKPAAKAKLSWRSRVFAQKYIRPFAYALMFAGAGSAAVMYASAASAGPHGPLTGSTGQCLEATNQDTVRMTTCDKAAGKFWRAGKDGTLRNQHQCLSAQADDYTHAAVRLRDCDQSSAQTWLNENSGRLKNVPSGLCLDNQWSDLDNDEPIRLWPCDDSAGQRWALPSTTNTGSN